MLKSFSIWISTILLLLTSLTHPKCYNSLELDGLCTSCVSPSVLSAGFCLTPLTGCIQQLSQHLCGACSSSYILIKNTCILSTQTSQPHPFQTTSQYIYSSSTPDYKYQLLDYHLKYNYYPYLYDKISTLSELIVIQTTYGNLYCITYRNPYSNTVAYQAEALVDYQYNIVEYSFQSVGSTTTQNIWSLVRKHIAQYSTQLGTTKLNKIQKLSSNDYRLYFVTITGEMLVIDIQKTLNPSSIYNIFTSLTQLYYQLNEQTVVNYVFTHFPHLQHHQNYTASYYTIMEQSGYTYDYYQFIFDDQIVVSVKIDGLHLSINTYEEPDNYDNLIIQGPAPGSYLPFLNLEHTAYLTAKNLLLTTYSFLNTMTIESVRYQIVSGTNYLINFNDLPFSSDHYIAIVYYPISGSPTVTSLHRNGIDITHCLLILPFTQTGAFNYELDTTFKSMYKLFRSSAIPSIGEPMSIKSVQKTTNINLIDYLVTYNLAESSQLRYNSSSSITPYTFLDFDIHGYTISINPSISVQTATRTQLLSYLNTEITALFSNCIVIKEVHPKQHIYEMDLITPYGTYFTRIQETGIKHLRIIKETSNNLCSQLDSKQHTDNTIIQSINSYLKATYSQLSSYVLTLSQGYLTTSGVPSYRLVYDSGNYRYVAIVKYSGGYIVQSLTLYYAGGCAKSQVSISGTCMKNCQLFTV